MPKIETVPTLELWLEWAQANGVSERMQELVTKHWRLINSNHAPISLHELMVLDRKLTRRGNHD